MTDKTSVRHVPVHCSSKASLSRSRLRRLYITKCQNALESKLSARFVICDVHLLKIHEISGADALRGNTRSHPEHDG